MKGLPLAIGLLALLFAGCVSQPQQPVPPAPQPNEVPPIIQENVTQLPEVPIPPAEENQTPSMSRPLGKEGEFCGGIAGIQCESGLDCDLESAYPDAGGVCAGSIDSQNTNEFHICPLERNEVCTMEYNPVCGRLVGADPEVAGYMEYASPCTACSKSTNAIGYYMGTCQSRGN